VYDACTLNSDVAQTELDSPMFIRVENSDVGGSVRVVAHGIVPKMEPLESLDPSIQTSTFPQVETSARRTIDTLTPHFGKLDATHEEIALVSAILWNAERIVQSYLALLLACDTGSTRSVDVVALGRTRSALVLPEEDFSQDIKMEGRAIANESRLFEQIMQLFPEMLKTMIYEDYSLDVVEKALSDQQDPGNMVLSHMSRPFEFGASPSEATITMVRENESLFALAQNAVKKWEELKSSEFWKDKKWLDTGMKEFDIKKRVEKAYADDGEGGYKETISYIELTAKSLQTRYEQWKVKYDEESRQITERVAYQAMVEREQATYEATTKYSVVSIVVARAILSTIVGRERAASVELVVPSSVINDQVDETGAQSVQSVREATEKSAQALKNVQSSFGVDLDRPPNDVAKLSEITLVLLALVST